MSRIAKFFIAGVLVVAAFGAAGWFAWGQIGREAGVTETRDPFFDQQEPMDGHKRYVSHLFRFSLQVPEEFGLIEFSEGDTTTLVFESPGGERGFQIFVVPYKEPQVSAKRFNMDVPSGVRDEPREVMVGGVPATAFYSTNEIVGDTYEVWFIRGGFLYEVTTRKGLESSLNNLLAAWRFE
jgi:hypothetical protein